MRALALISVAFCFASPALAHDRSVSYSDWQIRGTEAHVRLRVSALDASFLVNEAKPGEAPAAYFARRLEVTAGDASCSLAGPATALAAPEGALAFEWSVRCDSAPTSITSRILADTVPGHLHFARVRRDDRPALDRLLTSTVPTWLLAVDDATEPGAPLGFAPAMALGIFHVATGIDHVAFVATLLLGAAGIGEVLAIVTAFTIAHSLTLALAALGSLVPEASAIEALIGLSIALVAAENLSAKDVRGASRLVGSALLMLGALATLGIGRVPALTLLGLAAFAPATMALAARGYRRGTLRATVAFLFGLVHGFGFASVLGEARLEGPALAKALFGFNAGVELGQMAIVGLLAGGLWLAARAEVAEQTRTTGSTGLLAAGVAWFITRAYG